MHSVFYHFVKPKCECVNMSCEAIKSEFLLFRVNKRSNFWCENESSIFPLNGCTDSVHHLQLFFRSELLENWKNYDDWVWKMIQYSYYTAAKMQLYKSFRLSNRLLFSRARNINCLVITREGHSNRPETTRQKYPHFIQYLLEAESTPSIPGIGTRISDIYYIEYTSLVQFYPTHTSMHFSSSHF